MSVGTYCSEGTELSGLPMADREILEAAVLAVDEVPDVALQTPILATT
jgi:hypothetical protein